MRIGILYICTGVYVTFWKDFYLQAEKNLLLGGTIDYYIFTDAESVYAEDINPRIHRIKQRNLGWPDNTMKRFHMFLSIEKQLRENSDYLYFFNANARVVSPITGEELLPLASDNFLVGALVSYQYGRRCWNRSYERRRKSNAYIPYHKGKHYFSGALLGGTTSAYLDLCHWCAEKIDEDGAAGIIPLWHDESMINRYFLNHPPKVLDYSYCWVDDSKYLKHLIKPKLVKVFLFDKKILFSMKELGKQGCSEVINSVRTPRVVRLIIRVLNKVFGYFNLKQINQKIE